MKILVTGGSGFIGTNLIEDLLKLGNEILNVDIKAPKLDAHRAHWRQCDILDRSTFTEVILSFKPECVIHLAARTDTDSNVLADYVVNTEGTANVLQAIKSCPSVARAIITSTQFVNQYNGVPKDDFDFAPHTTYGESKVITEKLTRAANLTCTWTIIRPTNIWGPWHLRYPHEFWRVLGKGFYIHPSGDEVIRSYGYVKNVTWQICKMQQADSTTVHSKVFYVGDEPIKLMNWVNGFSRRQRGKEVIRVPRGLVLALGYIGDGLKAFGLRFPITTSRYKSMTTSNGVPMTAVTTAFGTPPYSLEDGIEETVRWLRKWHPDIVPLREKTA